MREYLFRGKRVDNGEWVYGAYYKQKQFYGDKCEQDCIIISDDILSNDLGLDYEEVIPETVCEYVGLKDKNGKKIFEGDIVKCRNGYYPYKVFVRECKLCIEDKVGIKIKPTQEAIDWFEVEVIGNLHDNPELLKKETNEND